MDYIERQVVFSLRTRTLMDGAVMLFVLLQLVLTLSVKAKGQREASRADRIILMPKPGISAESLTRVHVGKGRSVLKAYGDLGGLQVVQLRRGEAIGEAILQYYRSGLVRFAEPDYWVRPLGLPNDPYFLTGKQWGLRNTGQESGIAGADIDAANGWETLRFASNVVVAVIDSGIRYTHEDLAENMWVNPGEIPANGIDDDQNGIIDDIHGINAIGDDGNVLDTLGHGTDVAGIIGAPADNGKGIAGVAWKVQLMACRFLDSIENGSISDAIQCIDYARKNGAHIINASWGGNDYSAALYTAIQKARNAGIIVVASAGNEGLSLDDLPLYPASYYLDNIVSVCGTSRFDSFDGSYSNYSPTAVDVAAPGTDIYSTWHSSDSSYRLSSGTSMAAPFVSGILALMKARYPSENERQLIERLFASVDVLPDLKDRCATAGRVNLASELGPSLVASFSSSVTVGEPPFLVHFTNTSFGDVVNVEWAFGDGSPVVSGFNRSHIFAEPGLYPIKMKVTSAEGEIQTTDGSVRVAMNYDVVSEPFEWIDPRAMDGLELYENAFSAAQVLPFPFVYYGETNSFVFVGSNGILGFSTNGLHRSDNSILPSISTPNGIIAPYWDDLNPAGGSIYAGTVGISPNRRFVVSWVNVSRLLSLPITFQVVLEEGTGGIIFQYLTVDSESARGGGKQATVGLEDSSGVLGRLYSRDGVPHILEDESAIRFPPRTSSRIEWALGEGMLMEGRLSSSAPGEYLIEASEDLRKWEAIQRIAPGGSFTITPNAAQNRFFRARTASESEVESWTAGSSQ